MPTGHVTSSAPEAAATMPALRLIAQAMPAAKHHSMTVRTNSAPCAAVNEPNRTAAPIPNETPSTSGSRPCGLSCKAVAPAMAALPPAAMAVPAGSEPAAR